MSFFLLSVPGLASAQVKGVLATSFEKRLKAARINSDDFAVYIGDLDVAPVLDLNSKRPMIPASITKLVTAGAFLENFPPGTKFKTQLLSDAPVQKDQLKGSLVLKGGGDPGFVSESLWFLVNSFYRTGIRKIEGDLVIDDTFFDDARFDVSRSKERVDRAYDAPTGAMSFNWNSVNVFVRPGAKVGDPAEVWIDPENDYIRLESQVKTSASGGTQINVDRADDSKGQRDVIRVSGKIALGQPEYVQFKNITRPDLWAGYNLKSFLAQRGITVTGVVKVGKASGSMKVLAEAESKPTEQLVTDMNKFSNNYVAEMLTKHLGTLRETPGRIETGMKVINEYLESIGIPKGEISLTNPSGLTRDNRVTAQAMWKLLMHMENDFKAWPEMASSLPINGIDGTLKRRMKDKMTERQVRAKTGLLTGVTALAGFAGRKSGKAIPFVFIYNGNADGAKVRSVIDQFVADEVVNLPAGKLVTLSSERTN